MISLSPAAVGEVKRLQSKCQSSNLFLRLRVESSGCAGLSYQIGFEQQMHPDDQAYESASIQVLVDCRSLLYLNGLTVDYSEDLMGGAFRFYNPNATGSCSCGNSFTVG